MFALIESCPEQRPGFGWTGKLISLATHAFIISAAMALSEHVVAGAPYKPTPIDMVIASPPPVRPDFPTSGDPGLMVPAPICNCTAVPPVTVPPDLPPPGTQTFADPGVPGAPNTEPGSNYVGVAIAPDAPRDVRVVDELPILLSHPAIVYPEVLRQAGIEGRVVIETVLDTLGHAERALTRVAHSGTELFDREALSVVLASRYRPARVNGRAVRVRIAVPVNFTIRP